MGRTKRVHKSDEDNEIRIKIAKLEEKLRKKPKRRRNMESSSSESESDSIDMHAAASSSSQEGSLSPLPSPRRRHATTPAATTSTADPTPAGDGSEPAPDTDKELNSDILQLLGDAPKTDTVLGPAIHKDIATRWQDVLSKGLQKETKEKLLKEYLTPSNCDLLLAPELNPETKAALADALVKRDSSISNKQKQIGIALSALAVTIDKLLREGGTQDVLKPLSDACRILCDSHFCETRTRRNFVLVAVNSRMRDALLTAPRDKYLFGENVTEKLKTAKNILKSGDDLKVPTPQKSQFNKNNFIKRNTSNLNSQHRKSQPRGDARAPRGGYTQRPGTRSSARLQRDRAQPPPPQPRRDRSPPPRRTARS